ncbi:hypothetical protein F441_16477 [Phytophthora nicotianae CJ01A1]|uniref:GPI inositol-deacylase n=1 Tax=Phytophthora nicotianae CJ01A1 TaxID=1317063 RepID=W2WCC3_PHYNI|nr:hypothetical protein F441_16477 [Phytophthora nicotianae CJ01A1]
MWLLSLSLVIFFSPLVSTHQVNSAGLHDNLRISLFNASALRLHVTLKRESAKIHGQSDFYIFANPIVAKNGSSVLYDSQAAFSNGGTEHLYSVVNGTSYMTTVSSDNIDVVCLPQNTLSIELVITALNNAVPIPSASVGDEAIECTSGNLFKTSFMDTDFAICASGRSGFIASSSDLTVEVEYVDYPAIVQKPMLSGGTSCSVTTATSVTPTALALLTGTSTPNRNSRKLKAEQHMAIEPASCACKSIPRPCVFFHGNGNAKELEELQDTPENTNGRMGNMNEDAPCCTEVKYAVLNTVDYSWTDDSLQQKFCDRALRLSESSDKQSGVIQDTVVVTHSMAGLIMSMALATGKCSFGKGATWVAISSPMKGTMAADFLENACNDDYTEVVGGLFDFLGKCPVPLSRQSLVYQGGKHSNGELNAAYVAAQEAYRSNVSAAMCGNDYDGIFSKYQAPLFVAGKFLPHKSLENDGLVEYQSCAIGLDESLFGTSYEDTFYKPQLNHADTVFLTGDGLFKDSKKPVKWFECLL